MRSMALVLMTLVLVNLGGFGQGSALVVYTYDSFVSFGPAKQIQAMFKAQTGATVQFVATDDSRAMLARLLNERSGAGTPADVFVGVELNDLDQATREGTFVPLSARDVPNLESTAPEVRFDPKSRLVPYEHGFITLIYDADQISEDALPQTLQALSEPRFRDKVLLMDPRTSSPGLSFLLWTIDELGQDHYLDYWRRLLPNILTITPGWSEAFSLFSQGEAPMMVSFSTDHAFDVIVNGSDNIRVLLLDNAGYRTVFGAGVVDTSDQPALAKQFVNFLLSRPVQELLPTTEWMFPANPKALLPIAFAQNAVRPPRSLSLSAEVVGENLDRWLKDWSNLIVGN